MFTGFLLHNFLGLALGFEDAIKIVGFVVIERDVELVTCGLFECFLFGVLHQTDMLVESLSMFLVCSTFVCLQNFEKTLALILPS